MVSIKTFDMPPNAEGPRALICGMYSDAQVAPLLLARPEPTRLLAEHDG